MALLRAHLERALDTTTFPLSDSGDILMKNYIASNDIPDLDSISLKYAEVDANNTESVTDQHQLFILRSVITLIRFYTVGRS